MHGTSMTLELGQCIILYLVKCAIIVHLPGMWQSGLDLPATAAWFGKSEKYGMCKTSIFGWCLKTKTLFEVMDRNI